jgi:hypothetical protein
MHRLIPDDLQALTTPTGQLAEIKRRIEIPAMQIVRRARNNFDSVILCALCGPGFCLSRQMAPAISTFD